MATGPVRYLTEQDVYRCLSSEAVFDIVEAALRKSSEKRLQTGSKGSLYINDGATKQFCGTLSACSLDDSVTGMKWFSVCPGNRARGLPRVPATILICDRETGLLQGIMEASSLTTRRTAALAVVALASCAGARPYKAAIIGFGAIGQEAARYLNAKLGIRCFSVCASDYEALSARIRQFATELDADIRAERETHAALHDADLVLCATGIGKATPLVTADSVKAGATVCALGSYQEIDDALIRRAGRIIVDDWQAALNRGNLAHAAQSALITRSDIAGELADVVAGKVQGRINENDIVLASLVGLGALDIALGVHVLKIAEANGYGQELQVNSGPKRETTMEEARK